jgi:hypothetical protein
MLKTCVCLACVLSIISMLGGTAKWLKFGHLIILETRKTIYIFFLTKVVWNKLPWQAENQENVFVLEPMQMVLFAYKIIVYSYYIGL